MFVSEIQSQKYRTSNKLLFVEKMNSIIKLLINKIYAL